jgi:hypothetical protein
VPLELVPAFRPAARQSTPGFALDPAFTNHASGAEEAVEASTRTKRVEAIVSRALELFPAARVAAATPELAEQLRSEGEGSM